MSGLDGLLVLAFAAWAIASGLRARRAASRSLDEYFLAGRTLRGWQAGCSMAATQFAADTPLLVTGLIATVGIFGLWRLWIYALAFLLLGFVLAPCWRRAGVLTDAELAELRYSGRPAAFLRVAKALYLGTLFNCVVLAMVLFAAREICEPFLLWHQWLPESLFDALRSLVRGVGVPFATAHASEMPGDVWTRSTSNLISLGLLVTLTATYSAVGGLRAVVRTDLMQLALMLGATLAFTIWIVDSVGGLGALRTNLEARYATGGPAGLTAREILSFTPWGAREASWAVLGVLALQWLVQINSDGTGYLAQRSMACRSDRDARQAAIVFTLVQILLRSLLWLPLGVGLLLLFPPDPELPLAALRADREATFVRGMQTLPPGLLGLMLTAMLAALASTIDTHLNWGASYWTNDLYDRVYCRAWRGRVPSDRARVRVARLSSAAILMLALAILPALSSIQRAWQASLLLGAGVGVILVLRWLWWRITAWSELAALAVSALLGPALLWWAPAQEEAMRLLLMAAVATGTGILAAYLGPREPRTTLALFYGRARPPGFWSPVARECGAEAMLDRARLMRGLAATLLAARSVFATLTAAGSLRVGSPAAPWIPHRGVWLVGLLVSATAVLPIWWRLARLDRVEPLVDAASPGPGRDLGSR
ncbi:MAG: sodium transporter [Deltaproteobacteria bacterium]|nr:sodium transporter [Deltaproteobacteria bacterium]